MWNPTCWWNVAQGALVKMFFYTLTHNHIRSLFFCSVFFRYVSLSSTWNQWGHQYNHALLCECTSNKIALMSAIKGVSTYAQRRTCLRIETKNLLIKPFCVHIENQKLMNRAILVLMLEYSMLNMAMVLLWLLVSPGHQHLRYCLCSINLFTSSLGKNFNYLCQLTELNVLKW